MYSPPLFDDRPGPAQYVIGAVIPAAIGVLAGVLVGVTAAGYWVVAALAGIGAFLSGFEHTGGWSAADRGFLGGVIYGAALLIVHYLGGATAKVSLGSWPPFLVVVTALAGTLLAGAGGRIARGGHPHPATQPSASEAPLDRVE
jgi:hypothetical protein